MKIGTFLFKPVRLFLWFLASPWLWVTLAVLNVIVAVATLFWKRPFKTWMARQAVYEIIAAYILICIAALHHYVLKDSLEELKIACRRWWCRHWILFLKIVAAVVLGAATTILVIGWSNARLAKEIRRERDAWAAALPRVPEAENGFLVIMDSLKPLEGDFHPWKIMQDDFSLENESDMILLRECLAKYEEPLRKATEALKYDKFLFPADYTKGAATELPNLLSFKRAARLITLKGDLAALEGRYSDAFKEYLKTLHIGRTLSGEPCLTSRDMEQAICAIAFKSFVSTLSGTDLSETDLASTLQILMDLQGRRGDFFSIVKMDHYITLSMVADVIEGKIDLDPLFSW